MGRHPAIFDGAAGFAARSGYRSLRIRVSHFNKLLTGVRGTANAAFGAKRTFEPGLLNVRFAPIAVIRLNAKPAVVRPAVRFCLRASPLTKGLAFSNNWEAQSVPILLCARRAQPRQPETVYGILPGKKFLDR